MSFTVFLMRKNQNVQLLLSKTPDRSGQLKGQVMAEFALVVPLLLLLMCSVFDFSRMFFVQINLQDAVDEASRFASTGNTLPNPKGGQLSRVDSIIQTVQRAAWPGANLTNIQISSLQGGKGSPGGPGDTVTISLTTNLKLMTPIVAQFFPGGTYTFTSSSTFKNEPFPPNS
jgi:Flp pilus assembly protein TadG